MSLSVNKREFDFIEDETVDKLLGRIKYTYPSVIVRINDRVIPRSKYHETIIMDSSKIEVIHMISGG